MKRKKRWLRWIAWTLLLVLCMNSAGTTVLAVSVEEENIPNINSTQEGEMRTEDFIPEESTSLSEETSKEENTSPSEETPGEEITPPLEETPGEKITPPLEEIPEEEITPSQGELSEEEKAFEEQIAQEESPKLQEISEGFDIDFYVIIDGNKVKLQHNDITGIATWKDGRTTYYGVSIEDLLLIYEEFGFVKNGENQNPDANNKFVSAYRGKSGIEYGKVYTDTESGKTYVSYNYGQNKQGEAIDVYYLPNGKGVALNLKDSVKKDNSFYSVEVKGEGQDRIRYALTGTVVEEAVADFNPQLSDQTDQIEWTCMGTDDKVIDGIRESGNQTRFTIGKITQSYVIQRADQTAFDIQFYIYADNEVRKLPADSLKKVYKWNRQGRCYLSVSDLAEIYREFGLNAEETQSGNYFPYTVRGEKTLAQATVVTYKGQQYVSYTLDNQDTTVPTDVYYMPKGASDGEKIPDNDSDQIKQNKNSFYSVTVINPDGNRTVSYYKKDSAVTISVDPGDTKESDWLCASEDENETIFPVKQGDKLTFSIGKIEQPYTVACSTFAPATLNIKFYTFVNNERYNVLNEEIPVIKDTTTKPGTVYYYISNDELKKHFEKFHYDGSIQNGAKERFYYSKRDYDTIHNAGKYTIEGHECIYIGKSGEPMDVYYLPDGQNSPTMNASLEGEYYGKEIVWSCTSNDRDENEVLPELSGDDKVKFEIPKVNSSYEVIADKPQDPGTVRVIYNTTRYMKKLPKESKLTPQVGNKTRHTDDYENEIEAGKHNVKSPYPLVYDHEDNDSKELEQYEFDHWDYRNKDGKWQECGAGDSISDLINNNARQPITLYAAWRKVSNQNRKQVQFYICKSAMPEDGSVALPTTNVDDYTSAVAVANCNVKASILHDVPVLGNKNPSTWEQYADGNKRVQELLQGTKPDEGYIGNGDYIYKIDRIPSDEEVFQTIRESGRMIRIGDREIPPSKLDTEFFTIYWYSFKSEMSDGWHIDGRIVAKNGYLTVKKDFVGMPEAIEEVKKDYYIQVDMDEKLSDGKPQPPAFHQHMKLVLPSEDNQTPDTEAPQAEDAPIEVVGTWTDDTHTSCTWIVKADSFWKYTLKEYNYKPKDSNVKFSGWYNVRNSHEQGDNVNSWEAYPESGIQFTGRGIGRGGETLTIELENRYQKEGILTLNKFDESTGQGMEKINFAVSKNGVEEGTVTTDKYGIAQLHIPLQDENKQNRTVTETYLLRETNLPTGYVDTGDIQITVEIANGAFKIIDAKLVDREANENQEAVKAPVDGKIDGKSVLLQRGDTSLNIRNFAKTGTLHIKKTWENPNDALTEKQVKIRLYQNGISTGQEFLLNEENGWEHTVDNVPLFQDRNPVEYKVEEIEIGKTHYSSEYGDGFLYYEVIYPEIQYFDSNGQQIFPKDENEFKDVSKMELEVQNLHFNLAERSFLKTDDLPRNRLAGAGFLFYKVPYDDVTKKYADDTGYTVDYDNTQSKDDIVLKKDGKTCTTYRSLETDENGMLQLPEDFENGRYWMVESVTPNKKDKADKTKTQYQDNFNLYMVDVESDILFLYEKSPMTNTWRAVSDRHIVNHPQKGGVTVEITKEVTGPLGNRKKPFDMEILYWEDGQKLRSKTIRTSLKHGDKVTLKNVDISSDIIITETVDTSKYAVSISKKEENDKYSNPVQATSNGNTAVMKQRIEAARGDVIELKITNENTQLIPETGVRLETSRHVWLLFAISIIMILFFRRRRKIR